MNHRQHKAMRFVKLLWITKESEDIGFLSNKYIPSRGRDFNACISSRITTVIQVVRYHQINDNWFNEPFAVSLYRLLILRHAWLNLWDKHMTTGRINQVTTFKPVQALQSKRLTKCKSKREHNPSSKLIDCVQLSKKLRDGPLLLFRA